MLPLITGEQGPRTPLSSTFLWLLYREAANSPAVWSASGRGGGDNTVNRQNGRPLACPGLWLKPVYWSSRSRAGTLRSKPHTKPKAPGSVAKMSLAELLKEGGERKEEQRNEEKNEEKE